MKIVGMNKTILAIATCSLLGFMVLPVEAKTYVQMFNNTAWRVGVNPDTPSTIGLFVQFNFARGGKKTCDFTQPYSITKNPDCDPVCVAPGGYANPGAFSTTAYTWVLFSVWVSPTSCTTAYTECQAKINLPWTLPPYKTGGPSVPVVQLQASNWIGNSIILDSGLNGQNGQDVPFAATLCPPPAS